MGYNFVFVSGWDSILEISGSHWSNMACFLNFLPGIWVLVFDRFHPYLRHLQDKCFFPSRKTKLWIAFKVMSLEFFFSSAKYKFPGSGKSPMITT